MAYEKQNFADGQWLTADQLNHIEDGVIAVEAAQQEIAGRVTELEENGSGNAPEGIVCFTAESVNKFDGEWDAAVLNSDGTTKESSNYITNANYAKVEPGKYIAVTCQKTATSSIRQTVGIYKYAFYDAESNLVAYAANPTTAVILVPDGSCCVKLSIHKGGGGVSYADLLPMFELLDSDDVSTIASAYADFAGGGVLHYGFATDKVVNASAYTIGNGLADDTAGLQKALDLAAGGELFIPKGTYKVSGTLFIRGNTVVRGSGVNTVIQLAPNYSLTKTEWRETGGKWPIVTTDPGKVKTTNESGETTVVDGASHITVRDIAIYGDETAYHLKSQIGLQIRSNDSLVENVFVKNINYFKDAFPTRIENGGDNAPGYGIAVMYCDRVNVTGCICNGNGYEGIGTEGCNDVVISNCFVGDGNRTGIQVHRGSHNVTIANCTVNNINTLKDADITMHGHVDNPITDVKIIGCTIRGKGDKKGAIELVAGAEHGVIISGCNIESTTSSIYNEGFENFYDKGGSLIVKGNIFKSDNDGLRLYSDYVVCANNVIDCATNAIRTRSKVEPIVTNNLFVQDSTHSKVITVAEE